MKTIQCLSVVFFTLACGHPTATARPNVLYIFTDDQAVRALDEGVGRILQTLRDTGQAENTIVIFTSDQGFAWGQHGFRDKTAPYDANLCAPLVVSWPGKFAQGAVCAQPVSGPDIVKTIHALTGLDGVPADGRDFSALLADPRRDSWTGQPMLMVHVGPHYGNDALIAALKKGRAEGRVDLIAEPGTGTRVWMMMREGRHKYVRYLADGCIEELYDLDADPLELTNLALRRANHELLARLRGQCVAAFRARGAEFPDLLPAPRILDEPPVVTAPAAKAKSAKKKKKAGRE